MSTRKVTGIEVRRRADGTKTYRAVAYDKRADKKVSKTFTSLQAAKQWRTDAMAALGAGRLSADRGPTLADAVAQWLDGASAGTIRNRSGDPYKPAAVRGYELCLRRRVLPVLGNNRLGDLRHRDLQALIDQLVAEGHSASTVVGAITPLRAIYRRALTRGVVPDNPTRGLELPAVRSKPRRFCSPSEAQALLDALPQEDRALWATAFYGGLRRGELIALMWEDVDLATGVIHVRRGWDAIEGEIAPKSRQGRRKVPIPAVLRDYLVEHRMTSAGDGRVFVADRQVRSQAERAAKAWAGARLQSITLHEARHSYASLMIAAGVNAKALSTFMGHANIAVTIDLYGHLMPGSEAEAADLLGAYLAREAGGSTSPVASPDTLERTA